MTRILLTFVFTAVLSAQSLYHRIGYGQFESYASAYDAGLGYATRTIRDSTTILNSNPAAWHSLNRVYFRASGSSSRYQIVDAEQYGAEPGSDFSHGRSNFQQLQLGLPLGKNLGLSLGLEPVTNMNALLTGVDETGTLTEELDGGIWRYYLGMGYALSDNISVGLRSELLNGYYSRETQLEYDSTLVSGGFTDLTRAQGNLFGKSFTAGLQVRVTDNFSLSATGTFPLKKPVLDAEINLSESSENLAFKEELDAWPMKLGAGIAYRYRPRLLVLADLSQTYFPADAFDDARLFALPVGWTSTSMGEIHLGVVHQALDRKSRQWTERVELRGGLYSRNFYVTPVSEQLIYEYFATGGIGIPLLEGRSRLDFAVEFGRRTGVDDYPDEWITRLHVGTQLYERWFRKVKRR